MKLVEGAADRPEQANASDSCHGPVSTSSFVSEKTGAHEVNDKERS